MISADYLRSIAIWSRNLSEREFEQARRAIIEKSYAKGAYICHRGDRLDSWAGVASGLIKLSTISKAGKSVTFAGIRTGGWFGEGTVLKDIPRQYDLVALRDTRMAFMDKATFLWLFEHSVALNHYLVRQFNERLGQFMALVEYDRMLDAKARLARNIAWLFNPALYPDSGNELDISQEELGLITGISRQATNEGLNALEHEGLLRASHGGITVLNLGKLSKYGD